MKNLWIWFSILLFIGAGVVAWLPFRSYQLQDLEQIRPFRSYLLSGNSSISGVSSDTNHLFITVQKKAVYVLNSHDVVQHVIRIKDGPLNRINDIDGVASDPKGNMYVLVTTLDPQGLYVVYESIDEYSADGKYVRQVYRKAPPNPIYREGDIRSLHVVGKSLWFDYIRQHGVKLISLNPTTGKSRVISNYYLPMTMQVASASTAGDGNSPTYITTLTGDVYEASKDGLQHIYKEPSVDGMASKFPKVSPSGQGVDVFDAFHPSLVFIPKAGGRVQTLMNNVEALKQTQDVLQLADFQGWTNFNHSLIAATSNHLWTIAPDGTVLNVLHKFPMSPLMLRAKEMFIMSIIVMLACVLYWAVRLVWYVITKRRPLLLMSFFLFVPSFLIALVLLNLVVNHVVSSVDKNNAVKELRLLAHQGELIINGNALQQLSGPASVSGQKYHSLIYSLRNIYRNKSGSNAFYNTLYQYKNGDLYIVHDDDSKVQPFTEFPVSWNRKRDDAVLLHGQIVSEMHPDPSPQGYWLYALAPVYNSQNQIVGIYETGMDESVIVNQDHALFMRLAEPLAIIFVAIFLLVLLANLWLTGLVRKLRIGALAIANGNWGQTVTIKSKNEIQDLADAFNVMSGRLRSTFEQVRGLSQIYYRFVPDKFIQFIGRETISDVQLGDQAECEMSILVCNIRNFYQLSNDYSTSHLFGLINDFLGEVGPIIGTSGVDGFISRYLGNGFLALFPDDPGNSVKVGQAILDKVREKQHLSVGVGLHYGFVMLGVLGDAVRWEGSVLSEDVNLAQLVEEATQSLSASMLVTEDVVIRVPSVDKDRYRDLGRIHFSQLGRSVHLYDVLDAEDGEVRRLKIATKATFEEGVSWFQEGKFHLAREAFVQVIQQNPGDEAARLYFYAADEWRHKGIDHDWSGELILVDLEEDG